MGTSRLGSLLVEEGLLSEADRRTIKGTCGSHGPAFARSIIALGLLDEDELAAFLAEKTPWRVASKDLFKDSDQGAWGVVDRPLLERLEVLPLKLVGHTLYVAMVDPLDQDTIKQLGFFSGYKIHPVISTLSHIRSSLKKLLKNYEPASSQLEELIANHAVAAGRRVRLADLKPGATKVPEAEAAAPAETEDFEIEDEPAAEPVQAAPAPAPAPAANADLEYPDSVNAAEEGDLDLDLDADAPANAAPAAEAPAATNALSADDAAELMSEDPAGLDGLDDDLGADADLNGDGDMLADLGEEPAPAPEKKPSPMAAAAAADDLEDLADLSEFDPDKGSSEGGDDLDADLGGLLAGDEEAAPAPAAAEPAKADDLELEGDLLGDETLAADDLFAADEAAEAPAPVAEEPSAEAAAPAGEELGLEDDLMSLAVAEDDPKDIAIEPSAEPGVDAGEFDFDAPHADPIDAAVDPLAGIEGLEDAPAVEDPLAEAETSSPAERVTAALNGALLSLTMAKDLEGAVKRVAPALTEAGLSRGLLVDVSKAQAKPLLAWDPAANVTNDGLQAFVTPGLAPALARQFAGWTAFDDATRDANLKPFTTWLDQDHQLRVAAVPLQGDRQLVVLTAWNQATREDPGVKAAALEMVRKLAGKA